MRIDFHVSRALEDIINVYLNANNIRTTLNNNNSIHLSIGITNSGKIAQDKSPATEKVKCYEFMIYIICSDRNDGWGRYTFFILVKWDGNSFRSLEIENHMIFYFYLLLLQLYYCTYCETSKYRTLSVAKMLTVIRKSGIVSATQLLVCYPKNTRYIEVSVRRGFTEYDFLFILYLIGIYRHFALIT